MDYLSYVQEKNRCLNQKKLKNKTVFYVQWESIYKSMK